MINDQESYLDSTGFLKNFGTNIQGPTGHRARMFDKFSKNGLTGLQEHEILELLLFYVIEKVDTKPIAKALLNRFEGNIGKLFSASEKELIAVPMETKTQSGKTIVLSRHQREKTARFIKLISSVSNHLKLKRLINQKVQISSQSTLIDYLKDRMDNLKTEELRVIYLDTKNKIMSEELLSSGLENQTAVYPRKILRHALEHKATGIILVHNHPSGDLTPSKADIRVTEEIGKGCAALGIKLVDHIIIGQSPEHYYSFLSNCCL